MDNKDDLEYINTDDRGNEINPKDGKTEMGSSNKFPGAEQLNARTGNDRKKNNNKKLPLAVRIVMGILIGLIVLMLILACVFFAMRSSGKKKLYSGANSSVPNMGDFIEEATTGNEITGGGSGSSGNDAEKKTESESETTDATAAETTTAGTAAAQEGTSSGGSQVQNGTTADSTSASSAGAAAGGGSDYVYQAGDVNYNGHIYRYNSDILTFLVLGIDQDSTVPIEDVNINYMKGGQSDAIFLFVMNPHDKSLSVLAINRNTMTEIDMYDANGNFVKSAKAQICVQHGYGDGRNQSCERAKQTISEMLYNLPIHGYVSIRLGAVATLNDAVGGVDVTLPSDFPQYGWTAGSTVHLTGSQAYNFIRYRDKYQFDSATNRLGNEKAFLSGFVNKVFEQTKNDVTFPISLYQSISNYVVTDVSVDEMSYLASELLGYSVSNMKIYSLPGQTVMGKKFEEYYIDEAAMKAQVIEIFYELVK